MRQIYVILYKITVDRAQKYSLISKLFFFLWSKNVAEMIISGLLVWADTYRYEKNTTETQTATN